MSITHIFIAILAFGFVRDVSAAGTPQIINFPEVQDQITSGAPIVLAATASSGLPVSYSLVSTSGVATLTDDTLTLTGAIGSVTVKAVQSGDSTHDSAPVVFRSFVVGEASQRFVKIASGDYHSLGIRADGTLWAWGENENGELGDGGTTNRYSPVQIGSDSNWAEVSCGRSISVALRTDGTLWSWGISQLIPLQIGSSTDWVTISCGQSHRLALRANGTLWAWGNNQFGQLGDGALSFQSAPVQIGSATNWVSISAGINHSMAVRADGTLWGWGNSFYGQLGDGTTTQRTRPIQIGSGTNWASVACGGYHTVAERMDGTLWSWGYNRYGQLGDGTVVNHTSPLQVGSDANWAAVSCGLYHSAALRADGTIWSWGGNGLGAVGDRSTTDRTTPVQISSETSWSIVDCGQHYTAALRTDGTHWAWGTNSYGQLGDAGTTQIPSPIQSSQETKWTVSACGRGHMMAVRTDGTLWGWGYNGSGQLGTGDNTAHHNPFQIGTEMNWKTLACGESYSVALRMDGTLWAWGDNFYGQLGDESTQDRLSPVQIGSSTDWASVACGWKHTLALRTDGTLWAWGENMDRQLGDGTSTRRYSPVQVMSASKWSAVTCGERHTLAVRADGTLWAWGGYTDPKQIGSATNWSKVACGQYQIAALRADGTLWYWTTTPIMNSPVQVGTSTNWTEVSCGWLHTLASRSDGTLWAWGNNTHGQLGDGTFIYRANPVQISGGNAWRGLPKSLSERFSASLTMDGTLWTFGRSVYGELGRGELPTYPTHRTWPGASPQTIEFTPPQIAEVGQLYELAATSTSGLPVTYRLVSGPAIINGATLSVTAPGTVEIVAYQAGDSAWLSSDPVLRVTNLGNQTIHFPELADRSLSSGAFSLSATASSGLPVGYSIISGPALVSGNTVRLTRASGTVVVRAAQSGDIRWNPAPPVDQSFEVISMRVTQSILFTPPANVTLAESPLTLTSTANSGLPVTYTLVSAPAGTLLEGGVLSFSSIGTIKIRATQEGNTSFLPAPVLEKSISVKSTPATFALLDLVQTYTGTERPIRALNAPGSVTISYKIGTIKSSTPPVNAGSYAVEVVSGTVKKTGTLVINKAPLRVIPHDQWKFAGQTNPLLTFSYSGFLGSDDAASSVSKAPTLSTNAAKTSQGGFYPIKATGGTSANYAFVYVNATMVVGTFAGQYETLLVDPITSRPVGKLEVTITTSSTAYSGKLHTIVQAAPMSFNGSLTVDPVTERASFNLTITYGHNNYGPLTFQIIFSTNFEGTFTASVINRNGPSYASQLNSTREKKLPLYSGKPPVAYAGAHTVIFAPPQHLTTIALPLPLGHGFATAIIDAKGVMNLVGTLADGMKITASLLPDAEAGYRFYRQHLTDRANTTAAWFELKAHPDLAGRGYISEADLQNLFWLKAGKSTDANYRGGIPQVTCSIIFDPWLPPQVAKSGVSAITLRQRIGLNALTGAMGLSYIGLPGTVIMTGLPSDVSIDASGKIIVPVTLPPNPRAWKMSVTPTTGLFTGSFNVLDGTKPLTVNFSGVMRQPPDKENSASIRGAGHGLVPQVSGQSAGSTSMDMLFDRNEE